MYFVIYSTETAFLLPWPLFCSIYTEASQHYSSFKFDTNYVFLKWTGSLNLPRDIFFSVLFSFDYLFACVPAPSRSAMLILLISLFLYPFFERLSANRLIQKLEFSAVSVLGSSTFKWKLMFLSW